MMNQFQKDVQDLICKMVSCFQNAKGGKKINHRVKRGRAAASGSEFEKEFALLIEKHTPNKVMILIDFPASYKSGNKTKTIYPDIILVKKSDILSFIELKIDLGWYDKKFDNKNKIYEEVRKVGEMTINKETYIVSNKTETARIVLTGQNHSDRLPDFRKSNKNCYVLISEKNEHPNENELDTNKYMKEILSEENKMEWNRLRDFTYSIK